MNSTEELEARLAKARATKEEVDARRAAREESAALLAEVERAEIEAADAEALAAAEEEHGPLGEAIGVVSTRRGSVIVKRPNALFFRKIGFEIGSKNAQKAEDAAHRLIAHCLVYPTKTTYDALVETYPGVPAVLIGMIGKLAEGGASVAGE